MKKSHSMALFGIALVLIGAFAFTNGSLLQGRLSLSPGANVSRGEVAQVVASQFGITDNCNSTVTFPDVPAYHPFYCGIEAVNAYGLMEALPSGNFEPDDWVNRAEAAKIYYTALGISVTLPPTSSFSDVDSSDWFFEYVEALNNYGLFNNTSGNFNPGNPIKWRAFIGWFENVQ